MTEIVLDTLMLLALLNHDSGTPTGKTRTVGLSLGDRACLALGICFKLPVLTADQTWIDVADVDDKTHSIAEVQNPLRLRG